MLALIKAADVDRIYNRFKEIRIYKALLVSVSKFGLYLIVKTPGILQHDGKESVNTVRNKSNPFFGFKIAYFDYLCIRQIYIDI